MVDNNDVTNVVYLKYANMGGEAEFTARRSYTANSVGGIGSNYELKSPIEVQEGHRYKVSIDALNKTAELTEIKND